jgi:hypothetical protein
MPQEMRSERTDADPCAGRQLEVLRDASIVAETTLPIFGFRPPQGVAGSQKAVFVEGVGSQIVSPPVAGGNAWALNPQF